MEALRAARIGDQVGGHEPAWKLVAGDLFKGFLLGCVIVALTLAVALTFGVALGPLVIIGAVASGVGTMGAYSSTKMQQHKRQRLAAQPTTGSDGHVGGTPCSKIGGAGSPNVFIEGKAVARAKMETGSHSSTDLITQGCKYVIVNNHPLAREGDSVECGGKIIHGCENTFVGGPQEGTASDPVPDWFIGTVKWVGIAGDVVAAVIPLGSGLTKMWKAARLAPSFWHYLAPRLALEVGVGVGTYKGLNAATETWKKHITETWQEHHGHAQTEDEKEDVDINFMVGLNAIIALKPAGLKATEGVMNSAEEKAKVLLGESWAKKFFPEFEEPHGKGTGHEEGAAHAPPTGTGAKPEVAPPADPKTSPCTTCSGGETPPKVLLGADGEPIGPNAPKPVRPALLGADGEPIGGGAPKPKPALLGADGEPIGGGAPKPKPALLGADGEPIGGGAPKPKPALLGADGEPIGGTVKRPPPPAILGADGEPLDRMPVPKPIVDVNGDPIAGCTTCGTGPQGHVATKVPASASTEKEEPPDWAWIFDSGWWAGANFSDFKDGVVDVYHLARGDKKEEKKEGATASAEGGHD